MSSDQPDPSRAVDGQSDAEIEVLCVHGEDLSDRLREETGAFAVTTAPTVEAGLDRLADGRFDCVVSARELPDSDGLAFLRRVRERDPDLPFVLYVEDGSEGLASRAVSAGVSEYVRAGVDGDLRERIEDLVAAYRGRTHEEAVPDRAEREQQRRRQAEQFEAFGSVLSHDLRNPLNVVTGRLELLREDCEQPVEGHVDAIERATDRLETIIDDVSGAMRAGERVRDVEPIDLETAVRAAWDPLATDGATLTVEDSRRIRADEEALTRLLGELFGNAIEHGGEDVAVTVGTHPDGFYVADGGPGIDAADRQRVFEPGFTTEESKSGFGLASVHQIALAHGWDVDVAESEDGGARFEITDVEPAR